MKRILLVCNSDPRTDPRPNRMINLLKHQFAVTVVGVVDKTEAITIEGVKTITIFRPMELRPFALDAVLFAQSPILRKAIKKMMRGLNLLKKFFYLIFLSFEKIVWYDLSIPKKCIELLLIENFDLIIVHDLALLPFIKKIKKGAKVLFDAREYYTRNYDDQLLWRSLYKPVNVYLCDKYVPACDKIITVCDGLAQEYERQYGVHPEVIMSLPVYHNIKPSLLREGKIRIIHHGWASISRRIETMIEMMDYVDERFSLDLMLLPAHSFYWNRLVSMVRGRKNVRLIAPVPMRDIIPFTNAYDIGLFLCPPMNFNLKFALPNKFFEFIQARLAVAIGPSPEMKKIVEKYTCGIVAPDFKPQSLASELNCLSSEDIMYYKNQSHGASLELCAEANSDRIRTIIDKLTKDNAA